MARALALILGTVLLSGCADPIYSYSCWLVSHGAWVDRCLDTNSEERRLG